MLPTFERLVPRVSPDSTTSLFVMTSSTAAVSGVWPDGLNGWVDEPMNARSGCGRWLEHPDVAGSAGTWRFAGWCHRATVPEDAAVSAEPGLETDGAATPGWRVSGQADVRERAISDRDWTPLLGRSRLQWPRVAYGRFRW